MNLWVIAIAYIISIFGGAFLARFWVVSLKKNIDPTYDPKKRRLRPLDWSIGLIERGITTTLIIWAPALAAPFVGGWVALKFAANWEKRDIAGTFEEQELVARHRLIGLVGSAASIVVAVAAGLIVNPDASAAWLTKSN